LNLIDKVKRVLNVNQTDYEYLYNKEVDKNTTLENKITTIIAQLKAITKGV
jgi:hypothetical protein